MSDDVRYKVAFIRRTCGDLLALGVPEDVVAPIREYAVEKLAERRYQERRNWHVPTLPVWSELSETERDLAIQLAEQEAR